MRRSRGRWISLIVLCAAGALPVRARALDREYVVRWLPSTGVVAGYRAYLESAGESAEVLDLGPVTPDSDGIARAALVLDAELSYSVSMTAYNAAGESPRSNSVSVAASSCDPARCTDGDPCTADDCGALSCTHSMLPDGSICGSNSLCLAGECLEQTQPDGDGDLVPDPADNCAAFPNPDQADRDGNRIGDACECGDQSGDGTVDITDVVALNQAVFGGGSKSPLCDTNADGRCDVRDMVGVHRKIMGSPAYCSRNPLP